MLRARIRNSISSFQKVGGTPPFSFGNGLQFDGSDDNVTFGSTITGVNGQNNILSYWVKFAATNDVVMSRVSGIYLHYQQNITTAYISLGAVGSSVTHSAISLNTWYHYFIYNIGATQYLYINGVFQNTTTTTTQAASLFSFGGYTSFFPDITLDEVALYFNQTGSSALASQFYNAGAGDYATNIIPNPTAYWRMNGTSGDTTAIDEQGNYDGTLNNFNTSTCWVAH